MANERDSRFVVVHGCLVSGDKSNADTDHRYNHLQSAMPISGHSLTFVYLF